jgi:glucokinase-like ROK family protein
MDKIYRRYSQIENISGIERKKIIQEMKLIKYLYAEGSKSNAEVCKHLKLSIPKSLSILNELIESDLVEKQGRGISIGGRKPDLFRLKENLFYVMVIDMGKFSTMISIFDNYNNNITGIQTFPLILDNNIETIDILQKHVEGLITQSGINQERLMGIGISMPGLVDGHLGANHTYLNFKDRSLKEILEERLNVPVFIENDAKAVALAEYRFGLAKGKKNVLVIFLDWGIGLGLILNGMLYRGVSGFSGEFSHIPIVEDGMLCHCGKRGCLETIASGNTLVRMVQEGIKSGENTILSSILENNLDKLDPKMVVDAACNGDQYSIRVLSEVGQNLGKGLAILIQLFNPELIILTTPIQQSLNTYSMTQVRQETSITVSEMGMEAGLMGAVAVVMENILEDFIRKTH